jgi:ribose transport system permease protein
MEGERWIKKFTRSKIPVLLAILVGIIAVFSVWAEMIGVSFLNLDIIVSTIDTVVVTSFLAMGAGCLLISGNIDLSASANGAFAGVVLAVAISKWALPWPFAVLLVLIVSVCLGLFNAVLVNEFKFQSFIATMAMASVITSLMYFVSVDPKTGAATSVNFSNPALEYIGSHRIGGILPVTIIIMAVCFLTYGLILSKTKFGLHVYLVGGNPKAAKLAGINPKFVSYVLFGNCALMAGVAGIILAARTKQGSLQALATAQFTGMTAAILGGISFGGGSGGMGGCFIGLLIINTFSKGLAVTKFDTYLTTAFQGLLLLAALTIDYINTRRIRKKLGT